METTRVPEVTFSVDGQSLSGKLYLPEGKGPFPVLLIYHGYKSNRQRWGLFARAVAAQGIAVFAFNFRGCGQKRSWSEGDIAQQTIGNQLADALAAYDYLAAHPEIDPKRIACFGRSLGGYLAACVSGQRQFASMVLAAPSVYADEWQHRVISTIPSEELWQYRTTGAIEETAALQAIAKYHGPLLVIRHGDDEQVPARVPDMYCVAAGNASTRELREIEDTPHKATTAAHAQTEAWTKEWLQRTLTAD